MAAGASGTEAAHIEDEDSLFLATLKDGIEALGGRLEVTAVFPDRRVLLVGEPRSVKSVPSIGAGHQSSREE